MKILSLLLIVAIFCISSINAQTNKIIIDTDCGKDDFMAISLFLSMQDVEIEAIITSDGNLNPADGYAKLINLSKTLTDSIKDYASPQFFAGIENKKSEPPEWRQYAKKTVWGYYSEEIMTENIIAYSDFQSFVKEIDDEIIYIVLGPLTNIAYTLEKNKNFQNKIRKIIWYNANIDPFTGFNYEYDEKAAEQIFKSDVDIVTISNLHSDEAYYDFEFISSIRQINCIYTNLFLHNYDNDTEDNLTIWDELVAVYFLYPELFDIQPDLKNPKHSINVGYEIGEVKNRMIRIWKQDFISEDNIVFDIFPKDDDQFIYDVREVAAEIIEKYGEDEWKACVLTNELHRHLGIYSIVGAKMGIYALEYFDCEPDMLKIESNAGSFPPVSCLNDGLQSSTGATLGYGTISINTEIEANASAVFIYNDKKVLIKLKKEYENQIENDIKQGILEYGNLTDGYWKLIRSLGLKYWLEWDRNNIFDIEEVEED